MNIIEGNNSLTGLSSEVARQKQKLHGLNEITREKSRPPWLLFLEQFKSPLVIILIFACIISAVLSEKTEAIAIGAILLLNALIGFFQEYRAETALLALQEMTAPRAKIIRDGKQAVILAHFIVPEDVLLLEAGDIVAADAAISECSQFLVNEAILTGESLPVEKSSAKTSELRANHVYMGTTVTTGTATVKVSATGMQTELGKIAHLMATAQNVPAPLQMQLAQVGKTLLFICLGVVALVAVIGFYQGRAWLDILLFSVSLAVAAVPEGMPAIVTVALALGVRRLAAQNALIRKLDSVETLGRVSVICTDKTGTLTTGNMRVRELWGEDQTELLRVAASCCDAELGVKANTGDPTEIAILIAAAEKDFHKDKIEKSNERVTTEPFDSQRRRMSITRKDGITYVKGAIESLLPLCTEKSSNSAAALIEAGKMSARGLRVLAVATGTEHGEKNLKLIGLIGIADPPRVEAMQAIKEARSAGIIPIMITGDHPQTAVAIARELGLVIEGEDLNSRVHARATPEDKLNLVRHWKDQGAIVAMTGDGVNDAPALKEAHIGIAMGIAGTEVTRQAADLILADDNFATIITAVREGRSIFDNIRKSITYLLTGNFAEVAVVLGSIFLGLPLPLLAAHLLWINLVTDALPALTLVADPMSPDIMKQAPRDAAEQIMGRSQWIQVLWVGLLEAAVMLGLYKYLLGTMHGETHARNLLFTAFVFSQIFRSFAARSTTRTFWETGIFTNLWLFGVALATGFLQLSLHFIPFSQKIFGLSPLTLADVIFILPISLVLISVIELKKILQRFNHRRSHYKSDSERLN